MQNATRNTYLCAGNSKSRSRGLVDRGTAVIQETRNMYVIYLSLFLCVLPTSLSKTYCRHENNFTLKCNYFPKEISKGILRVIINDFRRDGVDLVINSSYFITKNWSFVKSLEISDETLYGSMVFNASCFNHLQMLSEIHIHLAGFDMSGDVFIGANSVRVLNMSKCVRLCMSDFVQYLNGTTKLPRLEVLDISKIGDFCRSLVIDLNFGHILHSKRIKELVITSTEISYFDLSIFGCIRSIENINLSYSQINHVDRGNRLNISDLSSLKVLDFSHLNLPKSFLPPPGKYVITSSDVADDKITTILNSLIPLNINLTSIVSKVSSIWIMNYTFQINEPLHHTNTRELVIKENNLKYLDLRCINNSISSIEVLDMSGNGLEFISPFVSSCFPRVKRLYLSKNQLLKMAKNNFTLFSMFAKSFKKLQILNFSGNNLKSIPYNMFVGSSFLEEIDLSNNDLQQVTFILEHLEKLKILNLGSNSIHILNDVSISRLGSIPNTSNSDKNNAVVIFTSNNISCSTCDAKYFIEWILKTNLVNVTSQHLKCLYADGQRSYITSNTVKHLKYLCHLVSYIVFSCSFVIVLITIVLAFAYKQYQRQTLLKQKEHRYNVIERLRGGHSHFKYACYLVYSPEEPINEEYLSDQGSLVDPRSKLTRDFVENNFLAPLERNLECQIQADRQLVCSDEDADGGRSDFNVFFNNLKSSSAVVIIASQIFFCNALNCWMLEQVIGQEKRIIFLTEDGVKYSFNKEETKRIFKNSKMFKYRIENDEVILKSSWSEVCTSILDITSLSESYAE